MEEGAHGLYVVIVILYMLHCDVIIVGGKSVTLDTFKRRDPDDATSLMTPSCAPIPITLVLFFALAYNIFGECFVMFM
jgi:hypothetical protein